MLGRFLFGDDAFISYSRRDGAAYAARLASELSGPDIGLSCFLDQWGASAASELSPPVRRALRRSRVLVLVGTAGAASSPMVREEVASFSRRSGWASSRPIIPIDVDNGLDAVSWPELLGIHRVADPSGANGLPSDAVVRLIRDSCTFTTRNQRVRMLSFTAAALLVVSVLVSVYAAGRARAAREQETIARQNAELAGQQETLAKENAAKADAERIRAEQQSRLAEARQRAASAALMVQQGNRLADGVRSAVAAMEFQEGELIVEAYQALRNGLAVLPFRTNRLQHERPVRFASLNRDATLLATADSGGVSVWDVARGSRIAARRYERDSFTGLSLSPDGSLLAVGYGGTLNVLRVPPRSSARSAPAELAIARTLALRRPERPAFSPDGRYLAALGIDRGMTAVWHVEDWREVSIPGALAVGFTGDGAWMSLVSRDSIRIVVPGQGREERTLPIPDTTIAVFSDDGSRLATADAVSINVWQWQPTPPAWQAVSTITHQGRIRSLAVSSDGRYVGAGGEDGTARIWSVPDQREVLRLTHESTVTALAFSRDGRLIVSAGDDGVASGWQTTTDPATTRLPHPADVTAIAVSADGGGAATIANDGVVRRWKTGVAPEFETQEGGPAMTDGELPYRLLAAAFARDGQHATVAVEDGTVFVWNLRTGTTSEFMTDGRVTAIAIAPRGDRVVLVSERTEVWTTGEAPVRRFAFSGARAHAAAFDAGGRRLALATPGRIVVVDAVTGKALRTLPTDGDAAALAFAATTGTLAFGTAKGVFLWDPQEDDAPVALAEGVSARALASSGDDGVLAAAIDGRTIAVWDPTSRRELARLAYDREVVGLAFSADGRHLGAATADRAAYLSLWRPADLIAEARRRLPP